MPSIQTQAAFDVLTELYGEPTWLSEPKKGMDIEKVFAEWDEALKDYSEDQIKTVCRKMWKYAKTSTFPRLGHILAMLTDVEKVYSEPERPEYEHNRFMDELENQRRRWVSEGFEGKICFSCDVQEALRRVYADVDADFPPENHFEKRSASELVNLAIKNDVFLSGLEAHLRRITADRPLYQRLNETGKSISVPAEFDLNNEKRRCA